MKVLKFKTNIGSEEKLKSLASSLDQESTISKWNLDTDNPDNILSVSGHEVEPHIVENLVEQAGYKAEMIHVFGAGGGDV